MEVSDRAMTARLAGVAALAGSACAVTGAALVVGSGVDLDRALAEADISGYLVQAAEASPTIVTGLSVWIVMAFLMGLAAMAMTSLSEERLALARMARFCYAVGVPLVIGAYSVWIAVVLEVAGTTSPDAVLVGAALGWVASRADWMATILVIGIGPTLIALAGRPGWVPTWLFRWSFVTAFAGFLTAVSMVTGGAGLLTYGFAIIPVGVGWMIAAGVVLLRHGRNSA